MDLDQFLIQQLNNKFTNQPITIDRLIVANIKDHNPQDFFPAGEWNGNGTKECYVLTPNHCFYGLVCCPNWQAGNGYWKGIAYAEGNIFGTGGLVGIKQYLCFYEGEQGHGRKTNWKMVEYRLQQHCCSFICEHEDGRLDEWVLCKVYEDLNPDALFSHMERMNI